MNRPSSCMPSGIAKTVRMASEGKVLTETQRYDLEDLARWIDVVAYQKKGKLHVRHGIELPDFFKCWVSCL